MTLPYSCAGDIVSAIEQQNWHQIEIKMLKLVGYSNN